MRFEGHNEEVRVVWEAYRAGRPVRVLVIFGINVRYLLLDPELNPSGLTFREYTDDPQVMLEKQLEIGMLHTYFGDLPQNGHLRGRKGPNLEGFWK